MSRISLDPPRTAMVRLAEWYSRRRFGDVLQPALALGHNPRVLRTTVRAEMSVEKWSKVPAGLKHLAEMRTAATVGCEWCMDFGYWLTASEGVEPAKIRDVPHWRDSDAYTAVERAALAYAEAMSETPPSVTDEHVAALREHLDEAQLVELSAIIAVENQRARLNLALGLESQGFAARCELAPAGG